MTVLDWLRENFPPVSPMMFYRGIFPEGELEKKGELVTGKYCGIIVEITGDKKPDGKRKIKRYSITDDLEAVELVSKSDNFCLCSPISYAGKERTAERARFIYALAVDLDKIRMELNSRTGEPTGLCDLYHQMTTAGYLPMPTYMVGSGTGLHLYYLLEHPLPLFHNIAKELQALKRELTRKIWNGYVVDIDSSKEIQQEGIYQGFRMPGTVTKDGGRAEAFLTGEKVTLEYLNGFVDEPYKAKRAEEYKRRGKFPLSEAKERFPDWYEKRVKNKEGRRAIPFSRAIYDDWLRRIGREAKVGHRYYCLMTLAMYAKKCSFYDAKRNPNPVTREELERDCLGLFDHMESLTIDDKNHFSSDDILSALESYDEKWIAYPRASIEYRTGIEIPAQRRKGQDQKTHLEIARLILSFTNKQKGKNQQGRKDKARVVSDWKWKNPDGSKAQCSRETGLDYKTVLKWWSQEPTQPESEFWRSLTAGDADESEFWRPLTARDTKERG